MLVLFKHISEICHIICRFSVVVTRSSWSM